MAINLSDNVQVNLGKPLDNKYLEPTLNRPYTGISEVNSTIVEALRHTGLTVNINGVEYWYASGVTNSDLVVKTVTGATSSNVRDVDIETVTAVTATTSSDFIGVNVTGSTSMVYLPSSPTIGLTITVSDIGGNANINEITIDGNGNNIDGGTQSFVNTNYGSLTMTYTGSFWKVTSFA